MKETTVSMRVQKKDREIWGKAARNSKNLSAFFISRINLAIKYHKLIEQAEKSGLKISAMKIGVNNT